MDVDMNSGKTVKLTCSTNNKQSLYKRVQLQSSCALVYDSAWPRMEMAWLM